MSSGKTYPGADRVVAVFDEPDALQPIRGARAAHRVAAAFSRPRWSCWTWTIMCGRSRSWSRLPRSQSAPTASAPRPS